MGKSFVLPKVNLLWRSETQIYHEKQHDRLYQMIIEIFNLTLTLAIASESMKGIKGGHQTLGDFSSPSKHEERSSDFFEPCFRFHYALKSIFSHFSYVLRGNDVERAWSHKWKSSNFFEVMTTWKEDRSEEGPMSSETRCCFLWIVFMTSFDWNDQIENPFTFFRSGKLIIDVSIMVI